MYVDSIHDRAKDIIKVVERDKDGVRQYKNFPARYVFYYPDPRGKFKDMHGRPVSQFVTTSQKTFNREKKMRQSAGRLCESDANIVFRCLEENYLNAEVPKLNKIFFDIETDFSKEHGFAPPDDPFNRITSIALHLSWENKTICLVTKPDRMTKEEAQQVVDKFDNVLLLDTEAEMLRVFLDLIDEGDLLTGWNSESFDIPYTVNRVARVLGKDYCRKFCLWGQHPRRREYLHYGKTAETFDLVGRVHLDLLALYRKYTYSELHSYSLDAVAEHELNEKKVEYDGTLDQLYNFDFEKFISYNIQDTNLLVRLDDKLQFIEQANLIAHANTVLLPTTMGAVAQIDQAVINEAHRLGFQVYDKARNGGSTDAAGGYVKSAKQGLFKWIGSIDLNSLYPSILRSLNMSPETIVGQLRQTYTNEHLAKFEKLVDAWEGHFACFEYNMVMEKDKSNLIAIDFEDGTSVEATGAEIYELIFHGGQPWALSANGTILDTTTTGIIPSLLERWYAERKQLQAKEKKFGELHDLGIALPEQLHVSDQTFDEFGLHELIELDWVKFGEILKGSSTDELVSFLAKYPIHVKDNTVYPNSKSECEQARAFWDKRQLVRKILLNSAYGALLNAGSKFFDQRLGQSTTLTGRSIAKHMGAQVNKEITGTYDHLGESFIYSDTDSAYFTAYPVLKDAIESGEVEWNKDIVVELYNQLCERTNETFPEYMKTAHNVGRDRGRIIAAKREIVALVGLFNKKKRYALMVYDDEGSRKDVDGKPGKVKVAGLEIKRSDTPKFMQEFLNNVLTKVLTNAEEEEVLEMIRQFRKEFKTMNPWDQGSPKRVNNITHYYKEEYEIDKNGNESFKGKARLPGHVRAAINYNRLRKLNQDNHSLEITDGMKTIVCRLKDNPLGITSIAIPIDEKRIPTWVTELPFDSEEMEHIIITKKVKNLLGKLNWDLQSSEESNNFRDLFSFE